MKSSNRVKWRSALVIGVCGHMLWTAGGCAKQESGAPPEPVTTEPANETPSGATSTSQPVDEKAADGKDDFKFAISLKGPDDKAVDWLVVEEWNTSAESGYVRGEWVEANKMKIETMNAERILLRLGRLPIASGNRIIVNLDGKGIEISRSLLPTVRMERTATGRWAVVK
jgi:hypothetical protein